MKRVIYTAIFGNKENLRDPMYMPTGIDLICFTDADFKSHKWRVIKIDPPHSDPVRAARKIKILAHQYLNEYDQSIWIDGNLIVRGDPNPLFDQYLSDNNLALYDHLQNVMDPLGSVKDEARYLKELASKGKVKDDPALIDRQLSAYLHEGFPDMNGLAITMVLLRNHNHPDIVKAMNDWWAEIEKFSRRDQMSFNYIAWKNELNFKYIPGDCRNSVYFKWVPHEEINWLVRKWHKLLKVLKK